MTMPPHDRVPPPPHEAHGPGLCLECGQVVTMHYTGRCRQCGDWCVSVPASELLAGDWFFDGAGWTQVSSVEMNDDGNLEVVTQWDIESVHSAEISGQGFPPAGEGGGSFPSETPSTPPDPDSTNPTGPSSDESQTGSSEEGGFIPAEAQSDSAPAAPLLDIPGVVERKSRTTVRPTARVWVAAHQRPKVGVLA